MHPTKQRESNPCRVDRRAEDHQPELVYDVLTKVKRQLKVDQCLPKNKNLYILIRMYSNKIHVASLEKVSNPMFQPGIQQPAHVQWFRQDNIGSTFLEMSNILWKYVSRYSDDECITA